MAKPISPAGPVEGWSSGAQDVSRRVGHAFSFGEVKRGMNQSVFGWKNFLMLNIGGGEYQVYTHWLV